MLPKKPAATGSPNTSPNMPPSAVGIRVGHESAEIQNNVTPAKAGVQMYMFLLDSGLPDCVTIMKNFKYHLELQLNIC